MAGRPFDFVGFHGGLKGTRNEWSVIRDFYLIALHVHKYTVCLSVRICLFGLWLILHFINVEEI